MVCQKCRNQFSGTKREQPFCRTCNAKEREVKSKLKVTHGINKAKKILETSKSSRKKNKARKEINKLNRKKKRNNKKTFYDTREWRELRYKALKKYGRKCMCCGDTPENGAILHVDHVKPRSKYPELELDINNLQILCEDCNLGKGAWDETDFRRKDLAITLSK